MKKKNQWVEIRQLIRMKVFFFFFFFGSPTIHQCGAVHPEKLIINFTINTNED